MKVRLNFAAVVLQAGRLLSAVEAVASFIHNQQQQGNHIKNVNQQIRASARGLQENDNNDRPTSCDVALLLCMRSDACQKCFNDMAADEVAWTAVVPETNCEAIVIPTLTRAGLCAGLQGDDDKNLFCDAFHACVYNFNDDDDNYDNDSKEDGTDDDDDWIDCSKLTECDWPGIHKTFIGDGVCQDNFDSCYNTAICNWDGGDCCEDTCVTEEASHCGSDGYACLNPDSTNCDPSLTLQCPKSKYDDKNGDDGKVVKCEKKETLYRLMLYDSFGDGWEGTTITITAKTGGSEPIFTGALESGAQGTEYVCLSIEPMMCYNVVVEGGQWGREASWDIRGYADGSPPLAYGGGTMKCEFSVAGGDGSSCENSCSGKSNGDPAADPDYKEFKDLSKCIDAKCMIQANACRADSVCANCFKEEIPEYCFSVPVFNAMTDCAVCKCTVDGTPDLSDFCNKKEAPGQVKPSNGGKGKLCTPSEVFDGSSAVVELSRCMDFSPEQITLQEFDQNNFGALDTFEACAHSFQNDANHGGHTALGCMKILANAMDAEPKQGEPSEMISSLAIVLYTDGEMFCECARKASNECPLCAKFYNLKTLLYESMDACKSLDEIDCAAWDEFQKPCKTNLLSQFGSIDFGKVEQCKFLTDGCNGVGPFPSFRRRDCESELPEESWDLYRSYERSCVSGPVPEPSPAAPTPAAPAPSPSTLPQPTGKTPYVPPEDRGKPSYRSPNDEKKRTHWFRNLVLACMAGGIGYYAYKRRSEFSFVRYRRIGGMDGGFGLRGGGTGYTMDDDMYNGLSLESSISFEPPSVPPVPAPMSMPNNGGYGA